MRDHDRINVRSVKADCREVIEDAAAIWTHGLAGAGFDQNPPTTSFDQQRVEVKRHVVGRQKCLSQHVLKLGFRGITGVNAWRTTNHAVAQDRCAYLSDAEAIITGVAGCW